MRDTYSPQTVEAEVQERWTEGDVYRASEHVKDAQGNEKPKFYVLSMCPILVANCTWVMFVITH